MRSDTILEIEYPRFFGKYTILHLAKARQKRPHRFHYAGNAINPSIELGQIEGGFIQGQGWLTMEEVKWKDNGEITTFSPSTYKIPAASDIPKNFNVEIYKEGKNKENVVNKSKTTGEPPLMLAMSVFFAIKDAIASVANYNITPILNAPATPESILMSIKEIKNREKNRNYAK